MLNSKTFRFIGVLGVAMLLLGLFLGSAGNTAVAQGQSSGEVVYDECGQEVTELMTPCENRGVQQIDMSEMAINASHFGPMQQLRSYTSSQRPETVAVGDLNADGVAEIVVGRSGSGGVAGGIDVLQNTAGTWTLVVAYPFPTNGSGSKGVALLDWDQDGDLDIVATTGTVSYGVNLYTNNGGLSFTPSVLNTIQYPEGIAVIDPALPVFAGTYNGVNLVRTHSNWGGTYQVTPYTVAATGNNRIAFADANGDGLMDLFKGTASGAQSTNIVFEWGRANGIGTFQPFVAVAGTLGNNSRSFGAFESHAFTGYGGNTPYLRHDVYDQSSGQFVHMETIPTYQVPNGEITVAQHCGQNLLLSLHSGWPNISQHVLNPNGTLSAYTLYPATYTGQPSANSSEYWPGFGYVWIDNQYGLYVLPENPCNPDLNVNKSANPSTISIGDLVTFTVSIGNQGIASAQNVVMTDTMPVNLNLISSQTTQGSCAGVVCQLGVLLVGQVVTVTIIGQANNFGQADNWATGTSSNSDLDPTNNTDNAVVQVIAPAADLSIDKQGSSFVRVGELLTYTLAVNNAGPTAANNVIITDTLPTGVTLQSVNTSIGSCSVNGQTIACNAGSLASQGGIFVTIVVSPTLTGQITNLAVVQSGTYDNNMVNNTDILNTTCTQTPLCTVPTENVLVLDVSGSMGGANLIALKAATIRFIEELGPDDRIGLVAFDDSVVVTMSLSFDHAQAITLVNGLTAGGGTNYLPALIQAHNMISGTLRPNTNAAVQMVSDGYPSDAAAAIAYSQVNLMPLLSVYGIGIGGNASMNTLCQLAHDCFEVENPDEMVYIYDLIREIECNPTAVHLVFLPIAFSDATPAQKVIFSGSALALSGISLFLIARRFGWL